MMLRRITRRSRLRWLGAAAGVLVAVVVAGPALADHATGDRLVFEECPSGFVMDCTWDEDGHVIGDGGLDDISGARAESFGGLVFLALLWSLIPAGIAAAMASSRDQSVGLAVVIALIFGWLGLAGLYFYWQGKGIGPEEPRTMPANFPPARDEQGSQVAARRAVAAGAGRVSARLRELQSLRDQGLIDQAEYADRRQAILNEV